MLGVCLADLLPIVIMEIKHFVNSQALPPITHSPSAHPGDNPERELHVVPLCWMLVTTFGGEELLKGEQGASGAQGVCAGL